MKKILPIIVSAQFLCTSLWFAGNAINTDMARELQLDQHFLAHLTSAIQFGFIIGTLGFAIFTISDRFSPSIVFFCSAMLAGFFNLGLCLNNITATQILLFRFLTGFFLAGIYPVGMKIASDYYQSGLGKSLGFLVGALVLGTAFPHLLKDLSLGFHWKYVLYATTSLSAIGGFGIVLFVPNGPYRKAGQKIKLNAFANGLKKQKFRAIYYGVRVYPRLGAWPQFLCNFSKRHYLFRRSWKIVWKQLESLCFQSIDPICRLCGHPLFCTLLSK